MTEQHLEGGEILEKSLFGNYYSLSVILCNIYSYHDQATDCRYFIRSRKIGWAVSELCIRNEWHTLKMHLWYRDTTLVIKVEF